MYDKDYENMGETYIEFLSNDQLLDHVRKRFSTLQMIDYMGGKERVLDFLLNVENDWILDRFETDYMINYLAKDKALEFFDGMTK